MNSSDLYWQSRVLAQVHAANVLVQYLASRFCLTLALLLIHLHKQVE